MGFDAVAFAQGARELAQAADAFGEHEHLFLAGDPSEGLGGHAAQQREAVAAAAHRVLDEALAAEGLGERGLGVGERLGVDGRVDVDADVAEDDALDAGDLGQRLLVDGMAGVEVAQSAQQFDEPAVGVAAAAADRVEQFGERAVGFEGEWLGGADLGHPGLHVLAGDAHEVRAVVDAQPVGGEFVEQVAGVAGVDAFADHGRRRRARVRRARRGLRRPCRAGWRSAASSRRRLRAAVREGAGGRRWRGWRSAALRRRSAGASRASRARRGGGRARCWPRARPRAGRRAHGRRRAAVRRAGRGRRARARRR